MLFLLIKTDQPEAELWLYDDERVVGYKTWQAHRILAETISSEIEQLLETHGHSLKDINGVGIFKGPGSFTGLRIGHSVANSLAYGLKVPICGGEDDGWKEEVVSKLVAGKNEEIVLPEYGSAPHTTPPRK